MGKNKLAKFAEMNTFPHVFQRSAKEIQSGEGFPLKGQWKELFFGNNHPIVLELGCGKGEYTLEMAAMFPNVNTIGVDIKGARMWTGAKASLLKGLKNTAFIRTNIECLPYFFAPNEVDEIWLTFPDPQMKKRTKRLTATNFLMQYQTFVAENGLIHLKTDSSFLFTYTSAMIEYNQLPLVQSTDDLYATQNISPLLNVKTFYEKQWLSRGITIKYLSFQLPHKNDFTEPEVEIEKDTYRSFGRQRVQNELQNSM